MRITKDQRKALFRIFNRAPIYRRRSDDAPITYRRFRKEDVHPTFGCDGAITVNWAGMWLCVEKDGYVHS